MNYTDLMLVIWLDDAFFLADSKDGEGENDLESLKCAIQLMHK